MGLGRGEGNSEEQKYLGTSRAGFGSTRGRGGMAGGGGKSWFGAGAKLGRREQGGAGTGIFIWIGSSQPNVSAGSQHAWKTEGENMVT